MTTLKENLDIPENAGEKGNVIWLSQKELAARWNVAQSTIINWRENGTIPYFRLPGSNRVLYPLDQIVEIEHQNTKFNKEVKRTLRNTAELKKKKPVMSAKPKKEWRI